MSILIIPVIDLLDGQVVHARGGRRSDYAPVRSPLCPSSEPLAVLAALLGLHPFSIFYAADLGAMLGREPHDGILERLRNDFPGLTFWVDAGRKQPIAYRPGVRTVIGTETGISAADLTTLTCSGADYILSLDFSGSGFSGDTEILARPNSWPRDVIIMNLCSVGAAQGPAWPSVDDVIGRAGNRNLYVAGGVRDAADMSLAAARGLKGALVATALHAGTLTSEELKVESNKTPVTRKGGFVAL